MTKITVDLDDLSYALESSSDCYINLITGEVVNLPDEYEDFDGHFTEEREKIAVDEKRFAKLDRFPPNVSFEIMKNFVEQLPDREAAKQPLLAVLQKSRPFRRFKDILDRFPNVHQKWFEFKDKEMEYWATWWLRKNDIEADVRKKHDNS